MGLPRVLLARYVGSSVMDDDSGVAAMYMTVDVDGETVVVVFDVDTETDARMLLRSARQLLAATAIPRVAAERPAHLRRPLVAVPAPLPLAAS